MSSGLDVGSLSRIQVQMAKRPLNTQMTLRRVVCCSKAGWPDQSPPPVPGSVLSPFLLLAKGAVHSWQQTGKTAAWDCPESVPEKNGGQNLEDTGIWELSPERGTSRKGHPEGQGEAQGSGGTWVGIQGRGHRGELTRGLRGIWEVSQGLSVRGLGSPGKSCLKKARGKEVGEGWRISGWPRKERGGRTGLWFPPGGWDWWQPEPQWRNVLRHLSQPVSLYFLWPFRSHRAVLSPAGREAVLRYRRQHCFLLRPPRGLGRPLWTQLPSLGRVPLLLCGISC